MDDISLQIYESVTSTMDVARQFVLSGQSAPNSASHTDWHCILAYEQTEGRGQRGRIWFAMPGQSFCATYIYHAPDTTPFRAGSFSLLAGIAVVEALKDLLANTDQPYDLGLKWPNDILLNGKKLGGILVDMLLAPDGTWVVLIGVGMNLTIPAFPAEIASSATSLLCEGVPFETPEEFARRLTTSLARQMNLLKQEELIGLVARWRDFDRTTGRAFVFEEEGKIMYGVATGISDEGMLCLRLDNGDVTTVQTASSLKEVLA